MPQAILPLLASVGITGLSATIISDVVVTAGLFAVQQVANSLFGTANNAPKPEDGRFNLKQAVPSLIVLLGKNKHGGDYFFLEESSGTAYHGIVHAAHHIKGITEWWLHDEQVTLDGSGNVVSPSHFVWEPGVFAVKLQSRKGLDAETTYADLVAVFPSIWDADHRGDGLASILMECRTVSEQEYSRVYPQQMPVPTVVSEGHDGLYDPRTETYGYSTNIALFRLYHLTQPHGGKLTLDDLYLPDWINAADVCDGDVTNRDGATEDRYHGGLRYRYNSDQVQVGQWLDQAADMVLYERPDGKIGVHAGEFVTPDVRITADDLISLQFDASRREAQTVLAVRGQWTDPANGYSTVDAAIYGNPYVSDDSTERTRTVAAPAVQSHNHMQRLQKLAFIRANAPKVQATVTYDAGKDIPYRRFVTIHKPPRLVEAIVEIIGRPSLSLASMTVSFEGIVVPATLYDFDAATEEGVPGGAVTAVASTGIPDVGNFGVTIGSEVVGGGATAAFATASWDHISDALTVELEWVPTAGGTAQSVKSQPGDDQVRTAYLADGQEYKFRARYWAATAPGDWTDYTDGITATADSTAPSAPTDVSATGGAGEATVAFMTPNSDNFAAVLIYHNDADDFATATLDAKVFLPPSTAASRDVTGLSAGTVYFWVTAANWSDVESDPVATGATTIS